MNPKLKINLYVLGGILLALLIVCNINILSDFFIFIGYNSLFFVDNFFSLSKGINPLVAWGLIFFLVGAIWGLFKATDKFKLRPRFKIISILGLLWFLFIVGVISKPIQYKTSFGVREENTWKDANSSQTYDAYNNYIKLFPSGQHINDAKKGMDDALWENTKRYNNCGMFERYLNEFCNGLHKDSAWILYEDFLWKKKLELNTIDGFKKYLSNYPKGKYKTIAAQKIWWLEYYGNLNLKTKKVETKKNSSVDNSSKSILYPNGNTYNGPVNSNGVKEGWGRYSFADGRKYVGTFSNDTFEGQGKLYFTDGSRFEGTWVNGAREGKGVLYKKDGTKEEQTFSKGIRLN